MFIKKLDTSVTFFILQTILSSQDNLLVQLSEKVAEGGDLDGRVVTAYLNQCTAEAQEVRREGGRLLP